MKETNARLCLSAPKVIVRDQAHRYPDNPVHSIPDRLDTYHTYQKTRCTEEAANAKEELKYPDPFYNRSSMRAHRFPIQIAIRYDKIGVRMSVDCLGINEWPLLPFLW